MPNIIKFLIIASFLVTSQVNAEVYKWVDENDKVHYGEKLPDNVKSGQTINSTINIVNSSPSQGVPYFYSIQGNRYEKNTDRYGGDLRTVLLSRKAKAQHCRNACEKDKKCLAWTMKKPSYNPNDKHIKCYLKWEEVQPVKNNCCISGTKSRTVRNMAKMEENLNYFGGDMKNFVVAEDDPLLCLDSCSKDINCKAWTYGKPVPGKRPVAMCWLKNTISERRENDTTISGIKVHE